MSAARTAGIGGVGALAGALVSLGTAYLATDERKTCVDQVQETLVECEARCNQRVGICWDHCRPREGEGEQSWWTGSSDLALATDLDCREAAIDLLSWIETICPAPRVPGPSKGECRLFHPLAQPTTERLLERLIDACAGTA